SRQVLAGDRVGVTRIPLVLRTSAMQACDRPSSDVVRRRANNFGPSGAASLVDCEETACQRPLRRTNTSVQIYFPLLSLPLYSLFSISVPLTSAVLPKIRIFISP